MSEESNESGNDSLVSEPTSNADTNTNAGLTGESTNNPLSTWKDGLSDTIKNDPALSSFKDVDGLAKSYIHAQKMVGSEKVAVPRDDWSESDWEGFYDKMGRPKTSDDYEVPEVPMPESFEISDDFLKEAKSEFHKLGLNKAQAEGIMGYYLKSLGSQIEGMEAEQMTTNNEATQKLQEEWGNDYNLNMDIARGALKKFGSPELLETLERTGLGNDIGLIKAFSSIGQMVMEDNVRGGRSTMELNGSSNAQAEINNLKANPGFMKTLFDRNEVGHQEAVQRWGELHNAAFPDNT